MSPRLGLAATLVLLLASAGCGSLRQTIQRGDPAYTQEHLREDLAAFASEFGVA